MDQLIFASLSHPHYWYEVGMLKVPGRYRMRVYVAVQIAECTGMSYYVAVHITECTCMSYKYREVISPPSWSGRMPNCIAFLNHVDALDHD